MTTNFAGHVDGLPETDGRTMADRVPPVPHALVQALAWATRRFHPKGTDRLLRAIHPPGNDWPIRTLVDYDDGLKMHIDTNSFCEWYIFFYGAFRPRVSELLNRMLKPGDVAFDIGADLVDGGRAPVAHRQAELVRGARVHIREAAHVRRRARLGPNRAPVRH